MPGRERPARAGLKDLKATTCLGSRAAIRGLGLPPPPITRRLPPAHDAAAETDILHPVPGGRHHPISAMMERRWLPWRGPVGVTIALGQLTTEGILSTVRPVKRPGTPSLSISPLATASSARSSLKCATYSRRGATAGTPVASPPQGDRLRSSSRARAACLAEMLSLVDGSASGTVRVSAIQKRAPWLALIEAVAHQGAHGQQRWRPLLCALTLLERRARATARKCGPARAV